MDFLLKNLTWHNGAAEIVADVRIKKKALVEIGSSLGVQKGEHVCQFDGHFAYPGLINAHDHLEMNLYPKLGQPPYKNYLEWGNEIYKPNESPIREIESLDIKDRLLWGGFKNLISGCTTVVHHNPWHRFLSSVDFPVNVLKKMLWMHSVGFGKKIHRNFLFGRKAPFVIHAAEGIDEIAGAEIPKINHDGLLNDHAVLIHAIKLDENTIKLLIDKKSSVIWCPASNVYMFGQTCPVDRLKGQINVGLGSDSTLTGSATLLDEAHAAFQTGLANAQEIFKMLTSNAATVFHLPEPGLKINYPANFFVAPMIKRDYFENLMMLRASDLKMAFVNGVLKFSYLDFPVVKYKVKIDNVEKFTSVDIHSLIQRVEERVPMRFLQNNPLWKMISA